MSGHNALQSEGSGSTNDRLDSILDALSALGDSSRSAAQSPATVHQLHAVPDLVESEVDHTPVAAVEEIVATAPPAVDVEPAAVAPLVPPAVPTFEDALPEVEPVGPTFEEATPVEPAPTTMPFEPESVVAAPDPIELVTPVAEAPVVADVENTVSELSVESELAVETESVFSTDHVFDTTSLSEASDTDATVFDAAPVEFEPPMHEPAPQVDDVAHIEFAPEVEAAPQVDVEPQAEPAVFVLEPDNLDASSAPETAPADASPATDEANAIVSMLEVEETVTQPEVTKPASIFRTTPASETADPIPSLDAVTPTEAPNDDDDWVSHHVPSEPTEPSAASGDTSSDLFSALATTPDEPHPELSGDALWHVDVIEPSPEEVTEEPVLAPIEESTAVEQLTDPWAETTTHVPELETEADVVDFFSMSPPEGASAEEIEENFVTDDELPIPDFTGVYEETPESTVWDMDATADGTIPLAEGEASKTAATARRAELDKLRPKDEQGPSDAPEGGELLAKEKSEDGSGKVVMVVLCGLVALAFIFVDDPGFLAFFEDLFDQFRG